MATVRSKTIEEIDNASKIIELMKALGILCKGLQSHGEIKNRLRMKLNPSVENPSWTAGQVRYSSEMHANRKFKCWELGYATNDVDTKTFSNLSYNDSDGIEIICFPAFLR